MTYYQITARGPQSAEIRIDGPIGTSFFEETVIAQQFVKDLAAIKAPTINVYINSPGGSVMDANVIIAALQRHPATVNIIVDGWALSAASLIAMAGDRVEIGRQSLMMIHNPRAAAAGDAPAMRKAAEVLDKLKLAMVDTYNARLKLAPDTVAQLLDAETWYSAAEAVAAGLADAIIPNHAAPSPVPAAIRNHFSFVPAAYAAYLTEPPMPNDSHTPSSPPAAESRSIPEPVATPEASATSPSTHPVVSAIDIDARVAAGIAGDRARVKAIRAHFAPWIKKGFDLAALQAECEDEGLSPESAGARILAALGAMANPLATGQGESQAEPGTAEQQARRKLMAQVSGRGV